MATTALETEGGDRAKGVGGEGEGEKSTHKPEGAHAFSTTYYNPTPISKNEGDGIGAVWVRGLPFQNSFLPSQTNTKKKRINTRRNFNEKNFVKSAPFYDFFSLKLINPFYFVQNFYALTRLFHKKI